MEDVGLKAVWDAVEPYLAAERLELDDLELVGRGSTRTLRVTVDGADVDLDRIAEVSKGLSRLLDHTAGAPEGSYQLEVTSPGLERKLTRPRHFQKSLGREAVVKTGVGFEEGRDRFGGGRSVHPRDRRSARGHQLRRGQVSPHRFHVGEAPKARCRQKDRANRRFGQRRVGQGSWPRKNWNEEQR